jgi:hypothetical protein
MRDELTLARGSTGLCFPRSDVLAPLAMMKTCLPPASAQAFADFLTVFVCGEESAVLAFEGLARTVRVEGMATALRRIAEEEGGHDALLAGVRQCLPIARNLASSRTAVRRFYLRMQERDPERHLARIVGLDSAVCTILSSLTAPGRGISDDPVIRARLLAIRRDETSHVRLGLSLTGSVPNRALILEESRTALAALLRPFGDCFDTLRIDPDRLLSAIEAVPGVLRR